MEEVKAEIETKVSKIVKLIQSKEGLKDSKKKAELLALVRDFHKNYQSLYSLYDHLREEAERRATKKREKLNVLSPSSEPESDSDYYSSEEVDSRHLHSKFANGFKGEFETACNELVELKSKLATTIEDKEVLNSEYLQTLSNLQEADVIIKHLRVESDEKEKELSKVLKLNEIRGKKTSSRIKDLEGQLSVLTNELQAQYDQKKDLDAQIQSKVVEVKQLGEKNKSLHSRISELELISKKKGDEIFNITKKFKENENNSTSRIEDLMTLIGNMQEEVIFLRDKQGELEGSIQGKKNEEVDQFKGLMDRVNSLQHELALLRNQKNEIELLLDTKIKENTENRIQLRDTKEELAKKTKFEQILLVEKESFATRVNELQLEVISLGKQKNELKDQIQDKVFEIALLGEEKDDLQARIIELESGEEIRSLQKFHKDKENESSNQIIALQVQNYNLQQELNSIQMQKNQMTTKISGYPKTSKEQENVIKKIYTHPKNLKEQEDVSSKPSGEHKLVKHLSIGSKESKVSIHTLERKMDELAEVFRMKMEDQIRLLYRRIYVAEQIHNENKNNFKKTKETLEQEVKTLEENNATYEAQFRKMRDVLQPGYNAFTGLDLAVRKLEDNTKFLNSVFKMSNNIQLAKTWVTNKNNELNQTKSELNSLIAQLESKETQEFSLREKVWNLEEKLSKEGGDKLNMMKAVNKLEKKVEGLEKKVKEKDEELLGVGEEKREAIRQLCMLMDYHRSRCDHLKRLISKMTIKSMTKA